MLVELIQGIEYGNATKVINCLENGVDSNVVIVGSSVSQYQLKNS